MEQLETERHRAVRDLERFKLNVQETVKVDEVPTEEKKESSPKKDGKAMNGETVGFIVYLWYIEIYIDGGSRRVRKYARSDSSIGRTEKKFRC